MEDYLSKLNQQQAEAVTYLDGPQLVIAGAGSGKTRVLTYKIVHLLAHGYEPWRILALTFTNKAAREMRQRIEALVGPQVASRLWMGTFHSMFGRILRQNADKIGFPSSYTIYDQDDSRAAIKTIIKDLGLDDKTYKPSVVQAAISWAKNALITPTMYMANGDMQEADRKARRPLTGEIYRVYRERCRVAGAMDFDDMLLYTNLLFKEHPEVRAHYGEFFRYVLVDEYQDTNFSQHCIVSQLCEGSNALTMVGDDAQSIYSFRGANIANILNLKNAYPTLRTFKLERNYRSTQNIVNAANSLIAHNSRQIRKEVFSKNGVGARVEVVNCASDYEEGYLVAARIQRRRMETKDSLEEFAVLYRTNAQSRRLEESLRKRNISYRIYGGLSFYQRKEVKDAIAYFRLAVNPRDDEALRRVINYPARGIGDTTVGKLTHAAIQGGGSVWDVLTGQLPCPDLSLNAGTRRKLAGFVDLVKEFNTLVAEGRDAAEVGQAVIGRTGLLTSLISDKTPESISKQENLQEILANVQEFAASKRQEAAGAGDAEGGGGADAGMAAFLAEVSLATDQDQADQSDERVTLMTVHAAKGLEFNNVIVTGVEEDLFPSAMAQSTAAEIEEERRLLYVALTRARNFCMMSYASSRFRNGQTLATRPSRFLRDIDKRYIQMVHDTDLAASEAGVNPVDNYRASYHSPLAPPAFAGNANFSRQPSQDKGGNILGGHPETYPWHGHRPSLDHPTLRSLKEGGTPAPVSGGTASSTAPQGAGDFAVHHPSEVAPGAVIEHERFGRGTVEKVETEGSAPRLTVLFSHVERRTLLFKFARFKILK